MNIDIDGFEIIEKIGQGGMASVWKARQLSLDRIVAIKVLSEGFSDEPDDIRRFQEEAQAAAKLKHAGIVQVHDAKAENGIYYFIMEYVSGYTVGDWVRRKGVLSEKDALLVADCVADALGYAWEHARIVHCDIKPDNIIIDEDGTVKVADLGLARTISVMESDAELLDEIMGTPAYISPEQAQGESNLDFRADIYSLGAMLYHLVTGKMMFEEYEDDEKLELHITDTVDDPLDINPSLSKGVAWLIERMTAKDRDLRESSWDAVREDINRVRHGLLPKGKLLPEGASTVQRSARRTVADYEHVRQIREAGSKGSIVRTALTTAVIAVALAVAMKMYLYHSQQGHSATTDPAKTSSETETDLLDGVDAGSDGSVQALFGGNSEERGHDSSAADQDKPGDSNASAAATTVVDSSVDSELVRASEMYEFAKEWQREHSDELRAAIEQFKTVEEETRGTKYSLMAKQEIRELEQALDDAFRKVMAELRSKTRPLVADGKFDQAIHIIRGYKGPYASETEAMRKKAVESLRHKRDVWLEKRQRDAQVMRRERMRYIDSLVMAVLADDLELAIEKITEMIQSRAFAGFSSDLESVREVLKKADAIDARILDSFRDQYGETIDVYLRSGMRTLTIRDVVGEKVKCRQQLSVGHGAVSMINIGVSDLSDYERLRRMGDDSLHEVALVKGIMAFQSNAYSHAEKYFSKTHPLLAKYLLAKIRGEVNADFNSTSSPKSGSGNHVAGGSVRSGERVHPPVRPHVNDMNRRNLRDRRVPLRRVGADRRESRDFLEE